MKDWLLWFTLTIFLLLCVLVAIAGCHTWQGFQQDIGIHKPEPKPETTPSPGVQLWNAAKKSNWLVTASILGIAAGVFALTNGAVKLGMASITSCCASLFMALAVSRFSMWLAVCGLIGAFAAALFSILARRKALMEIITGVQKYKTNGTTPINAILDKYESSPTKRIVKTIKSKLRLGGKI